MRMRPLSKRGFWRSLQAFSLVELLTVLAVIALLAALLLPALSGAQARAKSLKCNANLRQWLLALTIYANENEDRIPRRGQGVRPLSVLDRKMDWFNALPPMLSLPPYAVLSAGSTAMASAPNLDVFDCPSVSFQTNRKVLSYAMNMHVSPWNLPEPDKLTAIELPSARVFLADGPLFYSSTIPSPEPYSVQARHANRANLSFLDGHVQQFSGDYIGCGAGDPRRPDIHWRKPSAAQDEL